MTNINYYIRLKFFSTNKSWLRRSRYATWIRLKLSRFEPFQCYFIQSLSTRPGQKIVHCLLIAQGPQCTKHHCTNLPPATFNKSKLYTWSEQKNWCLAQGFPGISYVATKEGWDDIIGPWMTCAGAQIFCEFLSAGLHRGTEADCNTPISAQGLLKLPSL